MSQVYAINHVATSIAMNIAVGLASPLLLVTSTIGAVIGSFLGEPTTLLVQFRFETTRFISYAPCRSATPSPGGDPGGLRRRVGLQLPADDGRALLRLLLLQRALRPHVGHGDAGVRRGAVRPQGEHVCPSEYDDVFR